MKRKKPVLILETRDFIVESKTYDEKSNTYLLEGVFAEFTGEKNNNGRIYEAQEYLPHLQYLNKKINENRLFGELDHPEKFDISLSKVSHMITEVRYVEERNVIKGKIKIFDTRKGQDAQAILKGGGVLSISSRAAGIVNESTGRVQIKRIFTYDLVGDPGFSSAKLNRINESLNIDDPNFSVYEVADSFINDVTDSDVKYELNEIMKEMNYSTDEMLTETEKTQELKPNNLNKQNENDMSKEKSKSTENYVTVDKMNEYSKVIKKQFDELTSAVNEFKQSVKSTEDIQKVQQNIDNVISFTNYIAEDINEKEQQDDKVVNFLNYLARNQNKIINHNNYLATAVSKDVTELQENQQNAIEHNNYLAQKINEGINHNDYIVEGLNELKEFANYLTTNLNESIEHNDYLSEMVNKVINFVNYLSEGVNDSIDHGDYLATILDKNIQHNDHIAEKVISAIEYAQYIGKQSLPALPDEGGVNLNESNRMAINENNKNLSNKISSFLDAVEKRKTETQVESKVRNLLSEKNAYHFTTLEETDKRKVITAVLENDCKSEEEVMKVWEQALITPEKRRRRMLLQYMPNSVKSAWSSLNEQQQHRLLELSKNWDLSNAGRIKDFWFRQGLGSEDQTVQINEQLKNSDFYKNLNESQSQNNTQNRLGYSKEDMMRSLGLAPKQPKTDEKE